MKMFSEMMISSRSEAEYCHPPPEETAWPAMSAAPTTLLTSPAGVLARFLWNRSGSAAGSFANAWAEPTSTSPNADPANATAPTGLDRWNTTASPMPMQEPLHPGMRAGVASRMIRLPFRSTVTGTGFPTGWARIATPSWVQLCTGVSPTAITVSPALIPAALAGEACLLPAQEPWLYALRLAGTHALPPPIALVFAFSLIRPIPSARASRSTNESAKCMNEPATMTMARCQAGLFRIERGSSAGSTSSRLVIPVIRTKAPNGRALMPYSVSPRVVDHRGGPEPMKNWVACMPNFLAVRKCPASCRITEIRMATTKMTTPSRKLILPCLPPCGGAGSSRVPGASQLARPAPCPALRGEHVVQRHGLRARASMGRDYPRNSIDGPVEAEPAGQDRLDTDLVGGVVDGRGGPAGAP